ncbi:hypothetical protein [Marinomonas spartinae]|uniref:hypothetical protein n=1 Tax=Marinomonas spartinae TaxID=1792290 RepID=UPI001111E7A1|nr:hypothetical protein [Marinomonas spartinae]
MMLKKLLKLILRYRTNDMMRLVFHTEDLKKHLVESLKASEQFSELFGDRYYDEKMKIMPQVFKRLIKDEVLSEFEVEDLKRIIEKRNTIAHEVQIFTRDLYVELKEYSKCNSFESEYDYFALKRLIEYKEKIRSQWKGAHVLSMRDFEFEFADKIYKNDNIKLLKRIKKLNIERSALIDRVNKELSGFDFKNYDDYPKNTENYKVNGSLSKRGVKTCRDLLLQGLSVHTVSILMDVNLDRVKYQNRKILKEK